MSQLHPPAAARACTVFCGGLYIICALAFLAVPTLVLTVGNLFFHGIDLTSIARDSVTWGETILGLVVIMVVAYVGAWIWVTLYNKFLAK